MPHATCLMPPAAIEMDMSDSNRNRPPGAAKRSAAVAQTIGISFSPCPCHPLPHSCSFGNGILGVNRHRNLRRRLPPTSCSLLGSLAAISFNFSGCDAQMISAQFLAQIAFHLRPEKFIKTVPATYVNDHCRASGLTDGLTVQRGSREAAGCCTRLAGGEGSVCLGQLCPLAWAL